MNLIPCDQNCLHQEEGYCSLNHISCLTNSSSDSLCGYYEALYSQKSPMARNQDPAAKTR